MKILALDLGKSKTVACHYDSQTAEHRYEKVNTTPFSMHQLFTRREPDRIVFETGSMAGWVYDMARQFHVKIEVANPTHESWRWRNTKSKTDRKDALKLAKLSAACQLPTVYMPSPEVRQWRSLIKYRQKLVGRRTAVKNNIRSILDRQGLPMKAGASGWTNQGMDYLGQLAQPIGEVNPDELWRGELHEELECLVSLECRIHNIQGKLDEIGRANKKVRLLQTIPGVGARMAEALVAAIDDPHRFASRKEIGSYFGLVPKQFESGHMSRKGRITKQGNPLVRNLLVEVSWLALRYNPWVRRTFRNIHRGSKLRRRVAIVAVARRLVVRAWAMLRDETPWKEPKDIDAETAA